MRVENWPELLDAYVREIQDRTFVWGVHDCCTMAANWVAKCTGVDPMALWRGRYRNAGSAKNLITSAGGLPSMLDVALGSRIATAFAQRGDVVVVELALGPTVGIVLDETAVFPGLDGAERRLIPATAPAWRVG